ncbi:N-acetylmuramoyl-L-alanine amidase family protein [Indioceanicola profundi]|uniref:N-acetylmuramoyl-L-alanine amidase family protein n=1 Tax=Indioceanicola profundi TaxID=2220096 RepID=UPI001CEE045A|nr:N-acetylmuramoyl-L-alanine amidase [Indioceanicola profundi]
MTGWPAGPASAQSVAASGAPARKPGPPRLIVIDPGHGGRDPGAIGARGTLEKDITLDIARQMAQAISRQTGTAAVLTRDTDEFLDLKERVERARAARAELFISIHADSAPDPRARGLSAYTLSEKATDAFAAAIAKQENLADALGVDTSDMDAALQNILADLTAERVKRASLLAKQTLVSGAGKELRLLDNPMRSANFAVLKAPDVPSVLVETGFLSNAEDEKILRDAGARRRIATVLARELASVIRTAPFTA